MDGLKTSTRLRAIMALRRRLISSSLLPENMGPQITSIHPTLPVMISIRSVQHGTKRVANPVPLVERYELGEFALVEIEDCTERHAAGGPTLQVAIVGLGH